MDIRKSLLLLLHSVLWTIVGVLILRIAIALPSRSNENDFAHYYISSELLLEGKDPYQVDLREYYVKHNFVFDEKIYRATNPPVLIWLFCPLAYLTPIGAFWTWVSIETLSLFIMLWLIRRLLPANAPAKSWWVISGVSLVSIPMFHNFYFSQIQLLLTALVLAAYLLHKRGRYQESIMAITIAGMIKIYPLVLVPWFIWRAKVSLRMRGLYIIESALLLCGLFYVSGPELWVSFVKYGYQVITENVITRSWNYSLPSFLIRVSYSVFDFRPPSIIESIIVVAGSLSGLVIILLGYFTILVGRKNHDLEFSVLCTAMIIGNMTSWGHYLIFLVFPLATAYFSILHKNRSATILIVIVSTTLALAGVEHLFMDDSRSLDLYISYIPLYAMLVLFALLCCELLVRRQTAHGESTHCNYL